MHHGVYLPPTVILGDVTNMFTTTTRKGPVRNIHLPLKEPSELVGCRSPPATGYAFRISHIRGCYKVLQDTPFRSNPPLRPHLPVALPPEDDNAPEDSLSECCGHYAVSL